MPVALVVAGSLLTGAAAALVLVLVVFAGASEPVITGAALVGFGSGWAILALLTTRWTSQPQRWARVPAIAMAGSGVALLITRPGNDVLTAASWVWPPAALGLAIWVARTARRTTNRGGRWLVYPVVVLVTAAALGGTFATVTLALDDTGDSMPGARYDVGGHRLHLNCIGTGSPTVVLENGLNEISPLWSAVAAEVSHTTRVCAYDRVGQGWSDDISRPQDGNAVAADLHTLLERAGEHGPYVLAGHSSGGTLAMTYAARYPAQVAGLVLLDSSSPHQYTDQPDFAGTYAMMRHVLPVMPALARVAATRLIPASASPALSPEAAAQIQAFITSPRGARNMRDEQSELRNVFAQAQALTTFDSKPLAVVTARENNEGTKGWAAAQARMATLSTNSIHWTADTSHVGLLDERSGSQNSDRAIAAVVTAVRTGTPLTIR
ncbi:alpha/beta fold hydrolase [Angustibacter sp. McL0619]|uniref:alpha/beta fold hydrolase n=1 Tax=Angustibacter sp. McL0619 TaxID=3415676 RepID=UPI003CE7B740